MNFNFKSKYNINDLQNIVNILRGEDGCPWDKEQNHKSIRKNFIEETYEVIEAIDKDDAVLLREELGDVLLQVMFHSQMEDEKGTFTFDDVANDICQKLIIRHPHVFGNVKADNSAEVLNNWSEIKKAQKGQKKTSETLFCVPRQLPALMRTQKVQGRVKEPAFCCKSAETAFNNLQNKISKLSDEINNNDIEKINKKIGDVLFCVTNIAKVFGSDAEELLTFSCDRFIMCFEKVEFLAQKSNVSLKDIDDETAMKLWNEAKTCIQEE